MDKIDKKLYYKENQPNRTSPTKSYRVAAEDTISLLTLNSLKPHEFFVNFYIIKCGFILNVTSLVSTQLELLLSMYFCRLQKLAIFVNSVI